MMMMMHIHSIPSTVVITCYASSILAAAVPLHSNSPSLAINAQNSPPSSPALDILNLTTTPHHTPWPKAPFTYKIPGPLSQHLLFDEISPNDTGLEGQQATLHACDAIIRWLWTNYKQDQIVDQGCAQTSLFADQTDGKVIMVFVPFTTKAVGGPGGGEVIERELALDSVRALETLVWRYGGRSLECEILKGGMLKGRISVEVRVVGGVGVM